MSQPEETPPETHHDWEYHGKDYNDRVLWICTKCNSQVEFRDDSFSPLTYLAPSHASASNPCDEAMVKYLMEL